MPISDGLLMSNETPSPAKLVGNRESFKVNKTFALIAGLVLANATWAGISLGPVVSVSPTAYPVNRPDPPCEGNITIDAWVKKLEEYRGQSRAGDVAIDVIQSSGMGQQKHQDYANCAPVCAIVPANVSASASNIDIFWNPNGGAPDETEAYHPDAYDLWGPGPGWHRVDSDIRITSFGNANVVCMQVRNWSHTTTRTFQMRVTY